MPALSTTREFLQLVRKSGVLDEKRLHAHFPDESVLPENPNDCAALLVKLGLLTNFQAKNLLAGKYKGMILGTYRILEPIGQGAVGVVYVAEHMGLKRKVAVKVLANEAVKDELHRERFYREARSAATFDHRHIVQLYDIHYDGGVHFLVMEYVDGMDMQRRLARYGPVPCGEGVRIIADAAIGLQHAHEKGMVHRDIKPANLIVHSDGTVKILDMGLTRSFIDPTEDLTKRIGGAGEFAGTADYIPPEQALGEKVDARTDVYSCGATLFTQITGQPPYPGGTTQKLIAHQVAPVPRVSVVKPGLPPELDAVIIKAMAKKPADRYQTALELEAALRPFAAVVAPSDPPKPSPLTMQDTTVNSSSRTKPLPAVTPPPPPPAA